MLDESPRAPARAAYGHRRASGRRSCPRGRASYEEELSRVWPEDRKRGEQQTAQLAEDHRLRLRFYRDGLCAIFDKLSI
jgi:hypothetical protein